MLDHDRERESRVSSLLVDAVDEALLMTLLREVADAFNALALF